VTLVAVAAPRGVPYPLINVALAYGAAPLLIAGIQGAIGAAVLIAVAAGRGKLRGLHGHPGGTAGPFALLRFGEQRVSSSLAGILVATTPLFAGALAAAGGFCERPSRPAHGGPPTRRAAGRRRT
jgi:drug/metabolite transporter (DMT)-like permease